MKLNKTTFLHALLCFLILSGVLLFFVSANYIDFSVLRAVYLPVLAIVLGGILLGKYAFGYIFTLAAGLGLILEYLTHLSREQPTMEGAFLNTLLLVLGFLGGILGQIAFKKKES